MTCATTANCAGQIGIRPVGLKMALLLDRWGVLVPAEGFRLAPGSLSVPSAAYPAGTLSLLRVRALFVVPLHALATKCRIR